jgi:hypothetical protein
MFQDQDTIGPDALSIPDPKVAMKVGAAKTEVVLTMETCSSVEGKKVHDKEPPVAKSSALVVQASEPVAKMKLVAESSCQINNSTAI